MTKKFGFLRFVSGFYKVVGILLLIAGVLAAIGFLIMTIAGGGVLEDAGRQFGMHNMLNVSGVLGGVFGAIIVLIGFAISAICQFAISEAIMVFLAIEENTRATAIFLSKKE